jgi:flagellar motor switch protein FliN/FliY
MEQEKPDEGMVEATTAATANGSLDLVIDVPLRVTVEVGSASMLVREVLQFSKGSVIELDRAAGEPADVLVNGRLLARGEVTVEDDRLAVRIVEMLVEPPGS